MILAYSNLRTFHLDFFPIFSKAGNVRKRKVDELSEKLKEIREKKVATLEAIQKSQVLLLFVSLTFINF